MASNAPTISAPEWDRLRREFNRSLMLDTSLASLADNIDGCRWTIKGSDETPAVYIELDYSEALARLVSLGLAPSALDRLADILRGTLAFDESFGEMVDVAGKAEADRDPIPRNLERLGIPLDFPIGLCAFTPGTTEFCARENIVVISDFLAFSRGATRSVVIGGEFRDFLNSITHIDEVTIARFLPFRVKTSGLYLVEGLALLVRNFPAEQREQIARQPSLLPAAEQERGNKLAVYFKDQLAEMQAAVTAGTPLSRLVAPLDDIPLEPVVASLLRFYLAPPPAAAAPAVAKRGFFQRLFGRGK